jgi:DNA primase
MTPIDDIKSRLDIVEVITEHGVSLRKSGRSFMGFCPFHHNVNTPAFTVYPDTQSFYCFGCQAAGTVFDFVMRKQGLDFRDALQQLATRAGVELKPRTAEDEQLDHQRTRMLDLNRLAARYFNYLLVQHARGTPGREYLAQRGLNDATVEAFQLGYSLDHGGHLLHYLTTKHDYTLEEIEAAGLIINHAERGPYDRFRGRLMFPIRNAKGDVVGFGGRALGDAQPKYMNTPQTLLFDKSQTLYGLDLARDTIRRNDAVVIVEGYIDVITGYQHGFVNLVAPLGTALTAGHVAIIKKLTKHVYMALDADAAGQRATLKGLHAFAEAGDDDTQTTVTAQGMVRWQRDVDLHIIKMPPGRDPDDVIKSDPQQWQALIDAAVPVMDFYIDLHTADLDLSRPTDQSTALERLIPLVRQLDGVQQRAYISHLERTIGMRADLIISLLRAEPPRPRKRERNAQRGPTREQHRGADEASAPSRADGAPRQRREDYLLALLLRYPRALPQAEALLSRAMDEFPHMRDLLGVTIEQLLEDTAYRLIFAAWLEADMPPFADVVPSLVEPSAEPPALPSWVAQLDEALRDRFAHLTTIALPAQQEYRYQQAVNDCVQYMRREQVLRWQTRLLQRSHDTEDAAEQQHTLALLSELQGYLARLHHPRRSSNWEDIRDTLRRDDA